MNSYLAEFSWLSFDFVIPWFQIDSLMYLMFNQFELVYQSCCLHYFHGFFFFSGFRCQTSNIFSQSLEQKFDERMHSLKMNEMYTLWDVNIKYIEANKLCVNFGFIQKSCKTSEIAFLFLYFCHHFCYLTFLRSEVL